MANVVGTFPPGTYSGGVHPLGDEVIGTREALNKYCFEQGKHAWLVLRVIE